VLDRKAYVHKRQRTRRLSMSVDDAMNRVNSTRQLQSLGIGLNDYRTTAKVSSYYEPTAFLCAIGRRACELASANDSH
jgi:hypothetical protein